MTPRPPRSPAGRGTERDGGRAGGRLKVAARRLRAYPGFVRRRNLAEALGAATSLADDADYVAHLDVLRSAMTLAMVTAACRVLVDERDEEVRLAAAHLLGTEIGDHLAAHRVEAVATATVEDGPVATLAAVAGELGRLGSHDALPALRTLAAHGDAAVREAAAEALGALAVVDDGSLGPLAYLAGDEDPRVRHRSVRALARAAADPDFARDVLVEALRDPDPAVRLEAARGLACRADPRAIATLVDLWPAHPARRSLDGAVRRLYAATGDPRLGALLVDAA